jgi:hypothetical protein
VLVAYVATAAGASAEWSAPVDLSAAAETAEDPQVAVDAAGAATVVWTADAGSHTAVQARRIDPSGTLGPIQEISDGASGYEPQVAVDAAGVATIVWIDAQTPDGMIRSRRLTAAGGLEDAADVSPTAQSAGDPQVAVDPSGNAIVAWGAFDGANDIVYARRIDTLGTLGTMLVVSAPGESAFRQQIAVDPAGNAFIAWQAFDLSDSRVRARQIQAGGALRAIVTLSAAGERTFSPRVAVDASGNPTAAWLRSDGTIQARQGTAAGGLGAIADVSAIGAAAVGPELAVDPSGNATVVWPSFDGANEIVELRRMAAGGALGEIMDLWIDGDDIEPRVAVDGVGNATVVWLDRSAAGYAVESRTVAPDGRLGPTLDVAPASEELVTPRLATDPVGNSIAAWGRFDDPGRVIAGARFQAPAPPVPTPTPTPPEAPAPPPEAPIVAAPPASCATVTVKRLSPDTAGQPKSKRKRAKGVGAKLTLDGAGRVELLATTLSYKRRGKLRTVKVRTRRVNGASARARLRSRLPAKLARTLKLGKRVTLKVKARAGAADAACPFGKARTVKIRTKLIWVTA